jgi:hypothetical protein
VPTCAAIASRVAAAAIACGAVVVSAMNLRILA